MEDQVIWLLSCKCWMLNSINHLTKNFEKSTTMVFIWQKMESESIYTDFNKYHISNYVNGTDDGILWENGIVNEEKKTTIPMKHHNILTPKSVREFTFSQFSVF